MHCPACGYDNLIGTEVCDNCGADLAGHDLPQPAVSFHSTLLGEHLDELGAPAPILVGLDTAVEAAIAAMHDAAFVIVLMIVLFSAIISGDRCKPRRQPASTLRALAAIPPRPS